MLSCRDPFRGNVKKLSSTLPGFQIYTHVVDDICARFDTYLAKLASYCHERNMKISAISQLPLSLPHGLRSHLKLGVTFDSMSKSSLQATVICVKIKSRDKLLKALAGNTWERRRTPSWHLITRLIGLWLAMRQSMFYNKKFNAVDEFSDLSEPTLRTATGYLLIRPVDHVHEEAKVLPVGQHNRMLSVQYHLQCRHL